MRFWDFFALFYLLRGLIVARIHEIFIDNILLMAGYSCNWLMVKNVDFSIIETEYLGLEVVPYAKAC